jgi:hypothetical protein
MRVHQSMRRTGNSMLNLKRTLLAMAMATLVATGAFAQKQGGGDKRPPKDDNKVVVQPKGERPPPSNNNQGDKKSGDKKGKN